MRRLLLLLATCDAAATEPIRAALQRVADRMQVKYDMSVAAAFDSADASIAVAAGSTDYGLGMGKATRQAQPDDAYVWGSTTKMFTAPAVLQLVDQGVLKLSDPAAQHIDPALAQLNGTTMREHFGSWIDAVTIEHLLHMTSGIADYDGAAYAEAQGLMPGHGDRSHDFDPGTIVLKYTPTKADFTPGTKQNYCSTNYILLGLALLTHMHGATADWSWR
jgi:D-alanyl-D-alanine carboxypeptidase